MNVHIDFEQKCMLIRGRSFCNGNQLTVFVDVSWKPKICQVYLICFHSPSVLYSR